jgi:hypothetical protein
MPTVALSVSFSFPISLSLPLDPPAPLLPRLPNSIVNTDGPLAQTSKTGDNDGAIRYFDEVLRLDPSLGVAYLTR